ncbi:FG-GAP-like repeat-containing protein [Rubrivivax albus]|nr:FG-GAP-like repeat-containing protein [Rubrivivax albus]
MLTLVLSGCGGGGSGGSSEPPPASGGGGTPSAQTLFPLVDRAFWVYSIAGTEARVRVLGQQTTTSGPAWAIELDTAGAKETAYYRTTASAAVELNSLSADPTTRVLGDHDLIRFPPEPEATWVNHRIRFHPLADFDGNGVADSGLWESQTTVIGWESVTTPAGAFARALLVRTVDTQTPTELDRSAELRITVTSDSWYVEHVGLVRNVTTATGPGGNGRIESLLTAYRVGDARSDRDAPQIAAQSPAPGTLARTAIVQVTFDEPMDPDAANLAQALVLLGPDGQPVPATARWTGDRSIQLEPGQALVSGRHRVEVRDTLADVFGNRLAAPTEWTFDIDALGPQPTAFLPGDGATAVTLTPTLEIRFDEPFDAASVTADTLQLVSPFGPVAATVEVLPQALRLVPTQALDFGARHEVQLAAGLRDALGNAGTEARWSFTTDGGRFALPRPLADGSGHLQMRAIDLDVDGRLDLLTATISPRDASVVDLLWWPGQGDGTFATPQRIPSEPGCQPASFDVGDVDGDGLQDLLIADNRCAPHWSRRTGPVTFEPAGSIGTGRRYLARGIRLAEDSGRLGLLALQDYDVWLHRQASPGTFTEARHPALNAPGVRDMRVADLDGDGLDDWLVARAEGADVAGGCCTLEVWTQSPPGLLAATSRLRIPLGLFPTVLTVADVDGDGRPDLLLGGRDAEQRNRVAILRNRGTLLFDPPRWVDVPEALVALGVGRFNADGQRDLLTVHGNTYSLAVHLADGSGAFLPPEVYRSTAFATMTPDALTIADFNGDGFDDVAAFGLVWIQRGRVDPFGGRRSAR